MNILWWQILLLTLYAGYQILDELQIYSSLSAPVFAGLFAGLVMGDIKAGLIIGGSMQLTVLGVGTFGGASKIDANSGTILATAFSVSLGMNPEQAIAAIAVPVASLMIQLDILARFANTYFAHRIDKMVEDMNYKGIERNFLMGALPWSLSRMIPVFLALAFGGGLVQKVVSVLNGDLKWLGDGLSVAGAVLPAVGFAILLRYLPVKKHFPYLILGFTVTALLGTIFTNMQLLGTSVASVVKDFSGVFNALPMLAVALIGFALAAISYKNGQMIPSGPAAKKEHFKQINRRSLFTFQLGWNYERMQGSGYLYTILPQLRKIYGDDTPELKEVMKTHTQFFNTSNFFNTIITGIDLAIEEKEGIAGKQTVSGLKTGLMGPFAAIGDSIFAALIPTIFGALAANMAINGNPTGIFIWIVAQIAVMVFRWKQLEFAYREGISLVTTMQHRLTALTDAATLLGVFMVGALVATMVNVKLSWAPSIGDVTLNMQNNLDMILPRLLPAGIVGGVYWMLGKKNMTSTKAIFIVLIVCVALSALGVISK